MHQYKVITEKDSIFAGRFDPDAIERTLNEYAAEGWRVVNGFNVANQKTSGGQVWFVLERVTA